MHHAILDGWSVAKFITELLACYANAANYAPEKNNGLMNSYKNFLGNERLSLGNLETKDHWYSYLNKKTMGYIEHNATAYKTETKELAIPLHLYNSLKTIQTKYKLELKSLFFAAQHYVLSQLFGGVDITSNVVTHNRPATTSGDKTLGLFLNILPVAIDTAQHTWKELTSNAQHALHQSQKEKAYPFQRIIKPFQHIVCLCCRLFSVVCYL